MRVRLTLLATGLLAIALIIAAAIVLLVLNNSLKSASDAATSARAALIADSIASDDVGGLDAELLSATGDVDVTQILDAGGNVLRTSRHGDRHALVPPLQPGVRKTVEGVTDADGADYRVSMMGVRVRGQALTIVVGAQENPIHDVVLTVALVLSLVFPILLLILAMATYFVVGRALAPVEHIRSGVAEMSHRKSVGRVAIPDTDDEIATLATTMNDLLAQIDSSRQRQLQFVGDASHELRSPLVTIVGLADLSRVTGEGMDADTVSDILYPEAMRLQRMTEDLLLLARADEAGLSVDLGDVDLDELLTDEAVRVAALGQVKVTADLEPVRVRGSRDMLIRAIRNVVDNAVRHAHSSIELGLISDGVTAQLTVADDGGGISDADKQRVLERFVRLDGSRTRRGSGAGLGLAIVAEITRAHRGDIRIGDAPGGGAQVTIELPIDSQD
ncbi:HAMP domain-containing histidine kinase [Gordonia sp. TBRC 11910]|uniref:histidine kinase n=2 Tax=Gordonia asplenii TaxID=2725283 RepID=A0A848KTF2_9ACTN|nr:HAMP domain-containing histidine kinase [Gordonia asplenii]